MSDENLLGGALGQWSPQQLPGNNLAQSDCFLLSSESERLISGPPRQYSDSVFSEEWSASLLALFGPPLY